MTFCRKLPNIEKRLAEYNALLADVPYRAVVLPQPVFDLSAYFTTARKFDYEYFCFLNSYSIILDADWLMKLHSHLAQEVGIVGASGSYESRYSYELRVEKPRSRYYVKNVWLDYLRRREMKILKKYFAPNPNYHIRTNAFMLARDLLLQLEIGAMRTKLDTLRLESGKQSLTRQILAMNLKALVVGRDGQGYDKESWYESRTFRSGDQGNLLIADNRTREYLQLAPKDKQWLSETTWANR